MTDRPIIFSAPMIRALLAGRKSQTRRLSTSPLRRCEAGDRLWVRESGRLYKSCDGRNTDEFRYAADGDTMRLPTGFGHWDSKSVPSIHMPRWASRLTLIVEAVRFQRLQEISDEDALAEGVDRLDSELVSYRGEWEDGQCVRSEERRTWVPAYRRLWTSLHGANSWLSNPEVVAITFRVVRGNIDRGEG